jgi:uncharacterized RDD family membrane protein YckC
MGLITCPDCRNRISDAASACIKCGRPRDAGGFEEVMAVLSDEGQVHGEAALGQTRVAAGSLKNHIGTSPSRALYAPSPEPGSIGWSERPAPWVRCFARYVDIIAAVVLFSFVLAFTLPGIYDDPGGEYALVLLALVGWIFVEAQLLAWWGTTPGKALLRTRVLNADGSHLSYGAALKRGLHVWWAGLGLGIPLITIITMLVARRRLLDEGRTSWDRGHQVLHAPIGPGRWSLLALIFLAVFFFSFLE